jgi:hypothetical protein
MRLTAMMPWRATRAAVSKCRRDDPARNDGHLLVGHAADDAVGDGA